MARMILVSRVFVTPPAVTHFRLCHSVNLAQQILHAPKTTARDDCRLSLSRPTRFFFQYPCLLETRQILPVPLLLHLSQRHKTKRGRVDAITQTSAIRWTILKHMP